MTSCWHFPEDKNHVINEAADVGWCSRNERTIIWRSVANKKHISNAPCHVVNVALGGEKFFMERHQMRLLRSAPLFPPLCEELEPAIHRKVNMKTDETHSRDDKQLSMSSLPRSFSLSPMDVFHVAASPTAPTALRRPR
jgi:hypothetical protein